MENKKDNEVLELQNNLDSLNKKLSNNMSVAWISSALSVGGLITMIVGFFTHLLPLAIVAGCVSGVSLFSLGTFFSLAYKKSCKIDECENKLDNIYTDIIKNQKETNQTKDKTKVVKKTITKSSPSKDFEIENDNTLTK